MEKYSMLTLDLNDDVGAEDRIKFYSALKELKWSKVSELTTLWYASWGSDATEKGIIDTTKADVEKAAQASGIKKYDASTAVCGKPVVWTK